MIMDKKKAIILAFIFVAGATFAAVAQPLWLAFTPGDFAGPEVGIRRLVDEDALILENLPEFFEASVLIEGSGYVEQSHTVEITLGHTRPNPTVWLASGSYSLDLENSSGAGENIASGSFVDIRNTNPYVESYPWFPSSSSGTYDIVLTLRDIFWTILHEYTITSSAGAGGSISPLGAITVLQGDNQEFIITQESGYELLDVLIDETVSVMSIGLTSYEFLDVQTDYTIEAVFTPVATFSSEDGRLEGNQTQWIAKTWDAIYVNSTFEGLLEYSYEPLTDNVSFTYTIQQNGSKNGWTMDYYWDIERVGGGDRHTVIPESRSDSVGFDGGFLTLSDSFPAPEAGEWVLILYIVAIH